MGVINKTTEEINTLLDKVEGMPEEGVVGKTPVLETGTTTTLEAGSEATSEVVANGTDESGNPKYKLNFGIPKGYDGSGGSGGGGTADSVQWANVLNKPSWVKSSTKPSYTAAEVGALPAETTIPSKTSELDNDSKFVKGTELKTINGNSIVGSGNIEISGTGSGIADAPSDGQTYGRKNGAWAAIASSTGGSVDISDLYIRISQIAEISGTCTDEDYSTLKGYADNGTVTYVNSEGTSLIINIKNFSGTIILSFSIESDLAVSLFVITIGSSKQVTLTQKNILFDTNIGSGLLGTYTKPASYSAISKEDSISTAIGKLEAGLGTSGGGSSSDDIYYLPVGIANLTELSTSEAIYKAIGGDEGYNEILNAIKQGKRIYIKDTSTYLGCSIPVNADVLINIISLSFNVFKHGFNQKIDLSISDSNRCTCAILYYEGRNIGNNVYNLNDKSTGEDISSAFGGEVGLKKTILCAQNGNRLYIGGTYSGYKQRIDLSVCVCHIEDNGDMYFIFSASALGIWGKVTTPANYMMTVAYTKSSNTFEIQII